MKFKRLLKFFKLNLTIALSISLIGQIAFLSNIYAQSLSFLPAPGTMVMQSPTFVPVLLKGMTIHPENPFRLDFIVDSGNTDININEIKKESEKLVKYFLASMTIPKDDLWVNLSPYESNRIIPDELGKTELGRDMLAQDYLLKQLTASLMYPEEELGNEFWNRIYRRAREKFGTSEIPFNTFNKVWIIPASATVYENDNTVYVVKGRLKVLLQEDYLALQNNQGDSEISADQLSEDQKINSSSISSQIVREIILPAIEREINEGKNFAPLRQIYHSLILAKWYKDTIKTSLLSQVYIDQKRIAGVELKDQTIKNRIYNLYMIAYKKGVFDFIREDYDRLSQEFIPRKYFSGGEEFDDIPLKRIQQEAGRLRPSPIGDNYEMQVTMRSIPQKKRPNDARWGDIRGVVKIEDGNRDLGQFQSGYFRYDNEKWAVSEENDDGAVKVAKFEFRPGIEIDMRLFIDDALFGQLSSVDRRSNQLVHFPTGKTRHGDIHRDHIRSVEEIISLIYDGFPENDRKILSTSGAENLYYNQPVVAFSGGHVYYSRQKNGEFYGVEDHSFPMIVMWKDGHVSIENQIRFSLKKQGRDQRGVLGTTSAKMYIRESEVTDEVKSAIFLQLVMWEENFVDPGEEMANNIHWYDDLKQLFSTARFDHMTFPILDKVGMSAAVFFGVDQLLDDGELAKQAARGQPVTLKLALPVSLEQEEKQRLPEELRNDLINRLGYRERNKAESVEKQGDFKIDIDRQAVEIIFKDNRYPFHVVGVKADGTVVDAVVDAEYGESGATIRGVFELMKEWGVQRGGIVDQGISTRLTVGDNELLVKNAAKARGVKMTSMIYTTVPAETVIAESIVDSHSGSTDKTKESSDLLLSDHPGGIDLNNFDVDRKGTGINVHFDPTTIQSILDSGIDGFAPIIISFIKLGVQKIN